MDKIGSWILDVTLVDHFQNVPCFTVPLGIFGPERHHLAAENRLLQNRSKTCPFLGKQLLIFNNSLICHGPDQFPLELLKRLWRISGFRIELFENIFPGKKIKFPLYHILNDRRKSPFHFMGHHIRPYEARTLDGKIFYDPRPASIQSEHDGSWRGQFVKHFLSPVQKAFILFRLLELVECLGRRIHDKLGFVALKHNSAILPFFQAIEHILIIFLSEKNDGRRVGPAANHLDPVGCFTSYGGHDRNDLASVFRALCLHLIFSDQLADNQNTGSSFLRTLGLLIRNRFRTAHKYLLLTFYQGRRKHRMLTVGPAEVHHGFPVIPRHTAPF